MKRKSIIGVATITLILGGCAEYHPHLLNPVASEAAFRARGIGQSQLDLATLTNIALRNSAEMEVARAKVVVAEAALITARQRINPSLSGEGGYNKTPDSASTYSVSPAFTIETAGKRGYRILEAGKVAEASRIALYEIEWQVRSRVRLAAATYDSALNRLKLLRAEQSVRGEIVQIYSKRVSLGEAANPELDAARADLAQLAVSLRNAEGEVSQGLSSIAAAASLPGSALEGKLFVFSALRETPPVLTARKAGLLHRADIRRTLVEYEVADARLRLELANQYPNISLNPAYTFQEGFPAYTLGAMIESLPVFHHRQGQIAEAEAARHQAEAQFLDLQARVISQTELAQRQYAAAIREWTTARDVLEPVQQQREDAVMSAFRAGDRDRLDVARIRLLTLSARRATLDAMLKAELALSSLEDAVQSPLRGEVIN